MALIYCPIIIIDSQEDATRHVRMSNLLFEQ